MTTTTLPRNGMQIFFVIWIGQLVSVLGTGMTRFALLVWAYQQTGSATTVALLGFFSFIPFVLISPIAGIWVDRLDRRQVMMLTDLGAGLMTVGLFLLFRAGGLQIWHLYVAQTFVGFFESFQQPAYTAATTMLVPRSQYRRINGMRSLAVSLSEVVSPALAGLLLVWVGINGILLLDILTFIVGISTLLLVRIPHPRAASGDKVQTGWYEELLTGWHFIRQRAGLMGLMLIFTGMNFIATLTYFSILPAMVLARSGGSETALASVQAALGIGGVVGGVIVSIGGGSKRLVHTMLIGAALSFILGDFLMAVGRSVPVWMLAGFSAAVFIPFIGSADTALWQSKVPAAVQGRVFATKNMVHYLAMPLGYLLAGPLADLLFEPTMMPGGSLTPLFGDWLGTGPGAGIALMFLFTSIVGMLMSLSGYLLPAVRRVERDLPDVD